jgi:thiol-disulfide isomerase/thioredoxin
MRRARWLWSGLLFAAAVLGIFGAPAVGARFDRTPVAVDTPEKGKVFKTKSLEIDFSPYKVAFIELGSDRCIPCRQMQPIMKEIAASFPEDVLVVFYDVWKDPAPARKYKVQLIPTQIFLDGAGKEFFRHLGLFAKDEILELLEKRGLKAKG